MREMRKVIDDKKRLLTALLEYAHNSETFNPHFHKKELMVSLGVTEGEFNIMQKHLGDRYCHFVDAHGGDARYMINVSECRFLQEQYDQERIQEQRHKQVVRLAVLVAVLGTVLSVALAMWLRQ